LRLAYERAPNGREGNVTFTPVGVSRSRREKNILCLRKGCSFKGERPHHNGPGGKERPPPQACSPAKEKEKKGSSLYKSKINHTNEGKIKKGELVLLQEDHAALLTFPSGLKGGGGGGGGERSAVVKGGKKIRQNFGGGVFLVLGVLGGVFIGFLEGLVRGGGFIVLWGGVFWWRVVLGGVLF